MAFSFRAGTNWCHDFPKLARESGFYFNMHSARVRVDWNRISTIDIERVIRDRDFKTIDENVNNVIDYYLESEYDVKILDPNFVKLFRLAQLAVEYLLYCKQYLDQSVVILKEELKYKIEENVKMKEEITQMKDDMKAMKEKLKEKSKTAEIKSDALGEIHKCPHCPKTFVSASFANAHLIRRHSNISEVLLSSSPAHEEYRAETEKLHNEIKTLKERLNQTERVIRNESSNKIIAQNELIRREKLLHSLEDADSFQDDQYKKYQEEISNLKAMLFTEIRNIKRKDNNYNNQENQSNNESIKELVSQQESEIQRLRNQLQDHLTSNSNEVQAKLVQQEDYWKSKMEQLESQHRKDIDNLFTQLKLTQDSANNMKSEYEEKVSFLEKQSIDQSKLLTAQSEQLNTLTKGMLDSQNKKSSAANDLTPKIEKQRSESITDETGGSESSQNLKKSIKKIFVQNDKPSLANVKSNNSYSRLLSMSKRSEDTLKQKSREEIAKESNLSKYRDKKPEKTSSHRKITKAGNKYSSLDESGKSETSSVTESETETEDDSDGETSESSQTHTESTNDEAFSDEIDDEIIKHDSHSRRRSSTISLETVKQELQEAFEDKLRSLGIDPEWNGVPVATYKQKMESIIHHQNIAAKKLPKYEQIRRKILEEISKRISFHQKSPKHKQEIEKKSFLNKAVKNVKSKALKALNDFKVQKGHDTSTPVISSINSTPRESQPKRRFSLELLPRKPTHQDIQEIKRQTRLESSQKQSKKDHLPPARPKSSLLMHDARRQSITETILEQQSLPPPTRVKPLQRSYQSIEEFMRDIEESTTITPKQLDMTSSKVTSTPARNVKNILQDSYTFANDSDSQVAAKQDALWALTSPKSGNKSVLKSTTAMISGTAGAAGGGNVSSVKKKVLFDLEKESTKSLDESGEKREQNDSDWNISSLSDEKEKIGTLKEKTASSGNIQLKTSQSEKIAEISRKIKEKLEASRRKPPAGSIEAMFAAKPMSGNINDDILINEPNSITADIHSSHIEPKPRSSTMQMPRPAPRKQLFESKDSDLDLDIDELLAVGLKS